MPKRGNHDFGDTGSSPSVPSAVGSRKCRRIRLASALPAYHDCGDCNFVCEFCGAYFWFAERNLTYSTSGHPTYHQCCKGGTVILPYPTRLSPEFYDLYRNVAFLNDIRAYNSMFSMTSFRANVDDDLNSGRAPYVFKVSGQISHRIGSLCPEEGKGPTFLQLYLFDTENEVVNRFRAFDNPKKKQLDPNIVHFLIEFFSINNEYVRTFKTAKQMAHEMNVESYAVCLFNNVPDRRYGAPAPGTLGCIVSGDDNCCSRYDIVVHSRSGKPQRISKLHPSYMPLQYPVLFPYGEDGWCPCLKLCNETDASARNLSVNMYYSYQIHARQHIWSPILNSGHLFQQYLVDAYTCVEEGHLQYIVNNQDKLRSEYVRGVYDALSKGERESRVVGKRIFLPTSFTGGPRYMYSHYQDALSICRVYGNPQYFITFTCNVKWPEIRRYMETHVQHDTHSRGDIIARVFDMKVDAFIKFLKEDKTFGEVEAYLYTIEFQKRGLPHCHTLLWVKSPDKIQDASDVDKYITAELPDPISEPLLYQTVTTCMIHGPCGYQNDKAPCMKDGKCSKRYPKPFLQSTFFDKEGYVRYRRGSSTHHTAQSGHIINNGFVVPYNKRLCARFMAHINVEYCGWNMMIKYLFKYISKGVERVRYAVQKSEISNESDTTQHASDTIRGESKEVQSFNEVQNFLDGRYICPHEAAWRILNFHIHRRNPPVLILSVHEKDMQQIVFKEGSMLDEVLRNPKAGRTTLLGWFDSNARDPKGRVSHPQTRKGGNV